MVATRTSAKKQRSAKAGRWQTLREQYAPESYLHWLATDTFRRIRPRQKATTPSIDPAEQLRRIHHIGAELQPLNMDQLRSLSATLSQRVSSGEPVNDVIAPAFALIRECSRRILGMSHYDVQLLAGIAVCNGQIAEMGTGEGKTMVQSLAAYTRSLGGKGVHVATANSYLAARDEEFARPVYEALGIRSALLPERESPAVKKIAYDADITYGTGTEFGFDYLRDQLQLLRQPDNTLGDTFLQHFLGDPRSPRSSGQLAQRGLEFALIDEVDSILIDEASTPLVISRRTEGEHPAPAPFHIADSLVKQLEKDQHYTIEHGTPSLTEEGFEQIDAWSDRTPWSDLRRPWMRYLENALRANTTLQRDTDYLVEPSEDEGPKVVIIDQFTGRKRPESTWRDGLHQAVEATEGIPINSESNSDASISRQRFYKLYQEIGGMTGTARNAAGEFWQAFRLPVVSIAARKPSQAQPLPPRIFQNEDQKIAAVVESIKTLHQQGQPVLVGTRTIGNSEKLALELHQQGIPYQLLNARQDAEEAAVVMNAGVLGTITIATNMAGRGTHISLDDEVLATGGLHVIALEMEESHRIDRQLTGRAARQGQPGSSQMFLSAEDYLITTFAPDQAAMTAGLASDSIGEIKKTERPLKWFRMAQANAERQAYRRRKSMLRRDDWMSDTRKRL